MARYVVYANPDSSGYLLNVQADLLDNLSTRLVVPMMPVGASPPVLKRLNPIFDIRLCCTNRLRVGVPLSPDRPILRPL